MEASYNTMLKRVGSGVGLGPTLRIPSQEASAISEEAWDHSTTQKMINDPQFVSHLYKFWLWEHFNFRDRISLLIYMQLCVFFQQCCDLGYHASLNRALRTFLSAELNLEQSKHEGLDAIENAVENLDANSDKQRLMEMYNNVFCPPMKFEFQPHMGDMVGSCSSSGSSSVHTCSSPCLLPSLWQREQLKGRSGSAFGRWRGALGKGPALKMKQRFMAQVSGYD